MWLRPIPGTLKTELVLVHAAVVATDAVAEVLERADTKIFMAGKRRTELYERPR